MPGFSLPSSSRANTCDGLGGGGPGEDNDGIFPGLGSELTKMRGRPFVQLACSDTVSQNPEKAGVNPESSERRAVPSGMDLNLSCLVGYEDMQGISPGDLGSPLNDSRLYFLIRLIGLLPH